MWFGYQIFNFFLSNRSTVCHFSENLMQNQLASSTSIAEQDNKDETDAETTTGVRGRRRKPRILSRNNTMTLLV